MMHLVWQINESNTAADERRTQREKAVTPHTQRLPLGLSAWKAHLKETRSRSRSSY
jgi:hypothetical protein